MKISFLPLVFMGAVLLATSPQRVLGGDLAAPAPATPTDGAAPSTGDGQGHAGRFRGALKSLDLSEQQKGQIKQIISSTTDKKERRHQIWAVLTPEQQAKLKALRQQHKDGTGTASAPTDS